MEPRPPLRGFFLTVYTVYSQVRIVTAVVYESTLGLKLPDTAYKVQHVRVALHPYGMALILLVNQ